MQNKHEREREDPKPGRLFLITLISLHASVRQQLFQQIVQTFGPSVLPFPESVTSYWVVL